MCCVYLAIFECLESDILMKFMSIKSIVNRSLVLGFWGVFMGKSLVKVLFIFGFVLFCVRFCVVMGSIYIGADIQTS